MNLKIVAKPQTKEDLNYDRQYYFLFTNDQKLIGHFACTNWSSVNSIEIFALKIKKNFRKHKIGTQVIDFLKTQYHDQNIWAFANQPVVNFYRKNGFHVCLNQDGKRYLGEKKEGKVPTILMSLDPQCPFIKKVKKVLPINLSE